MTSTTAADTTAATPATGAPGRWRRPTRGSTLALLERFALLGLLVLLCLFFATWARTGDVFASPENLRNILGNETVNAVLALAVIMPLTCGQFDLSVGAIAGLASIAVASATAEHGAPLALGVAIGVAIGATAGFVNGLLVAQLGVTSLIATLGTATLISGLVSLYTDNQAIITGIPEGLLNFGIERWLGLPRTVFAVVLVAASVYYLTRHTPLGRYWASVGANAASARLVGLRVNLLVVASFIASGALAGIAGVLLLARAGAANPDVGPGFTLAALSAAFLGATAIDPGRFNVLGTLIGVLFVAVSVNGLVLAGAADWVQPTFNGTALVIAVAVSVAIARRRAGAA